MQIYDSKLKAMREMTEEEEYYMNNMPDPEQSVSDTEVVDILLGNEVKDE